MTWILLSLISATSGSLAGFFDHSFAVRHSRREIQRLATCLFFCLLLVPLVRFERIQNLNLAFWLVIFFSVLISIATDYFHGKNIEKLEISTYIPSLNLVAVFSFIFGFLIYREKIGLFGLLGTTSIIIGSYLLNLQTHQITGFLSPLKKVFFSFEYRPILYMSVFVGLRSNIDKLGIDLTGPLFFIFWIYLGKSLYYFFFTLITRKSSYKILFDTNWIKATGLNFINVVSMNLALSQTVPAYVLSIVGLNSIFSVILGYFFFKEHGFKQKLASSVLMIFGAILISFS